MQSTLNAELSETRPLLQTIQFIPKGMGCIKVPIQVLSRSPLMNPSECARSAREDSGRVSN